MRWRRRRRPAARDRAGPGARHPNCQRLHRLPARPRRVDGRQARAGRHERGDAADRRHRRAAGRRLKRRGGGGAATLSIAPMRSLRALTGALLAGLLVVAGATAIANAAPITPTRDDEVIEVLPATSASRSEDRQLRKRLAEHPGDAALAAAVAQRYLEQARESGDPRFAGLALAALRAWPDAATAPADVLFLRATLEQYLHEFDASVAHLRLLLGRPGSARNAQAWLTLATVLRVQGRYADSDTACSEVGRAGADVYA